MDGCNGRPRHAEQGYIKACPIAWRCKRFELHLANSKPSGYQEIVAPYDFDDEECGKFVER